MSAFFGHCGSSRACTLNNSKFSGPLDPQGTPALSQHWQSGPCNFWKFGFQKSATAWGQPPYFDAATQLGIVADARLVDRDTLKARLGNDTPGASSDISLVLQAYRKWGEDSPNYLFGDFAFAIWDPGKNLLFCARDHIGAKPFYFAHTGAEFFFATDLNLLLEASNRHFEFDTDWLIDVLRDRNLSDLERTFYRGVHRLSPGHSLSFTPDANVQISRYWRPENVALLHLGSDKDYSDALYEQLTHATQDCLSTPQSTVIDGHHPGIGVHVTGGLDSSAIAMLANGLLQRMDRKPPLAFCWHTKPDEIQSQALEHRCINALIQQENLDVSYTQLNIDDVYNLLVADGTKSPITNTLKIEQAVQKEAEAKGIGVILSGWGGDDFASFAHKNYHSWLLLTGRWRTLSRDLRGMDKGRVRSVLSNSILPLLRNTWWGHIIPRSQRNRPGFDWMPAECVLHPQHFKNDVTHTRRSLSHSSRQWMLGRLRTGYIADRLESWAVHGRQRGIEYRYPLLDRRVIEFALSLPPGQYRRGPTGRFIFRNAIRDKIPDIITENAIKTEPVRIAAQIPVFKDALKRIASEIESGSIKISRSDFVDMGKMRQIMQGETKEHIGAVLHALPLLNLR